SSQRPGAVPSLVRNANEPALSLVRSGVSGEVVRDSLPVHAGAGLAARQGFHDFHVAVPPGDIYRPVVPRVNQFVAEVARFTLGSENTVVENGGFRGVFDLC